MQENVGQALDIPPVVEVNIPLVNELENFLPIEIQEDDLMADEKI
jgi:hypothetical protein